MSAGATPARDAGPEGPPYYYEDFDVGRVFEHHWGRTVTETDAVLFATQTHQYSPIYFNSPYARRSGLQAMPVSELLVFSIVLGLSVEDLSESGGTFLGADKIRFLRPVLAGDTLVAVSSVVDRRESRSRPGWGVVRWSTVGLAQHGHEVVEYERASLVRRRPVAEVGRKGRV